MLEEERRGCFIAVTRAGKRLILSRAKHYRGWPKAPSRFLEEMGCLDDHGNAADRMMTATSDRRLIEDYLPVDWLSAEASDEP